MKSKFNTFPSEVHSNVIYYLSIQSLMRLYQTSRYWKHKISSDKFIWRKVYERHFGHEFAKDRWILWAIRRLWSQSSCEKQRLAARQVSLTTLDELDGYTWYRLVCGRVLTERNWRNDTPQRSIFFPKEHLDTHTSFHSSSKNGLTYGLALLLKNLMNLVLLL
jgi:hypothetical protein